MRLIEMKTIESRGTLRKYMLGINILLIIIVISIYYLIQIYQREAFSRFEFSQLLILWEYVNRLHGSLLFFPLLCLTIILWKENTLIIWAIWLTSVIILLPHIIFIYNYNYAKILLNILFLLLPLIIFTYIKLQFMWYKREKRISEEKEKAHRNYLAQVFKAQDDERKRIAKDIHDDSIQKLAVIASELCFLKTDKHIECLPEIKGKLEATESLSISISHELRNICRDLMPTILDDLGLISAVRWLIDDFQKRTNIRTVVKIVGNNRPSSRLVSITIFRIIQEALNNVRRHSGATHVIINIEFKENVLKMLIQDNGKGFVVPSKYSDFTNTNRLGIFGIQQRAELLNGKFNCESEIDYGTTLSLEIPFENG